MTGTYQISELTHVARSYVEIQVLAGAASTLAVRSGGTPLLWTDAAARWVAQFGNILAAASTGMGVLLERFSGGVWLPVAAVSESLAGDGALTPCSQITMTLRDSAFEKVKVVVMDTNEAAPQKLSTPTSGNGGFDAWIAEYIGSVDDSSAYNWLKSRGDRFLLANPFVSVAVDLNDRVRRDRGLI
jgi:hypothetical protein